MENKENHEDENETSSFLTSSSPQLQHKVRSNINHLSKSSPSLEGDGFGSGHSYSFHSLLEMDKQHLNGEKDAARGLSDEEIANNNNMDKTCTKIGINGVTFVPTSEIILVEKRKKAVRTGWGRFIGIILAITSSMAFALQMLIVKSLPQYNPYSKSFWSFQGILHPSLMFIFYYRIVKKEKIFDSLCPLSVSGHKNTCLFLFLRGLVGTSALVFQVYSLHFISMADSSVMVFSMPVFVSLAASVLLGEKSGIVPVFCGTFTLLGVVVITRPPILTGNEAYDTDTLIGSGLALSCMICAGSTFLILRFLRQLNFSLITAFFGFWGSIQTFALAVTIDEFQLPEGLNDWLMASGLVVTFFVGQTSMTLAFKYETAGVVSLCRTCDVLFAFLWQFIFFGVVPDVFSLIGGAIVVFGVLIITFRKFLSELPDEHPSRQTFWLILK